MSFSRAVALAIVLAGSLSGAAAASSAPATGSAAGEGFTLDEYSVFASGASGVWQAGAGLTFGNSYRGAFHLFGGGRISWVQVSRSGESTHGWGLGVVGGVGYLPDRKWSPVATLAFDKLFDLNDEYHARYTATTGVRLRLGARLDRQSAISLHAFGSTLHGVGEVENESDYGLVVSYSLGFYE